MNKIIHTLAVWGVFIITLSLTSTAAKAANEEQAATLYQRLGGLAPISVVVSDFIDALMPDQVLNANPAIDEARNRVPAPYLKYHVTAMVCEVTGGPCKYQGRSMKTAHAHLNITDKEWARMVEVFKEILAKHKVPEAEGNELLAIIGTTKADIVAAVP
ncbi:MULTISPECIES: group I truncated hemoglobin [unclassified Pseudoalteromonas]|uniref:group I truncated hemoglobin n=1 Tax=unclassified Pseudoalteromonas TaxID=194690 RepID=UPI000CF6E12A|nr:MULTISPECIES: group 1 truncated hemoglobin [unclassified Pseudoalteromonas]MBS3798043.1 group 1 truncated hemoglobin [Pseudoalteromonas sp. BDTF-M6]